MKKIRWGILSTAKIGREKVIPAMQVSQYCSMEAIASRDTAQAQKAATALGIAKAYGSYEALLQDENIDAVYIPLPNHMHVPWAIKALEANKHVLCEKPVALSAAQAKELQEAALQRPHLKIMEAFMYRFHPQWIYTKQLIQEAAIGELKHIQSFFSYYNDDASNIRNQPATGGGGMMDIGCYCISLSRFIFGDEPVSVFADVTIDPVLKTDTLTSGILHFAEGSASFTCSTQLMPYQRVNITGSLGRIEIEIPFNAPPDSSTRIWLHTKGTSKEIVFEAVDQYTLQGDLFSKAILDNTAVATNLQDAVNNMIIIEAILKSGVTGNPVQLFK
jgi:predicted dehydrogenase